jgi:hypothetical protein
MGLMSNSSGENQSDQNPYDPPKPANEGQQPYSQPSPYAPNGPGEAYGQSTQGQQPYSQPSPYAPSGPVDPYGQPAYGQPAYGQPAYGQPYGGGEHPQGTLILVFGILGIFVGIFAPVAWYMGSKARKEIAAAGAHYSNEQNINIGRILGLVFTIIYIVSIVLFIIFFVVIAGLAASQSGR